MTLEEARERIGQPVVYLAPHRVRLGEPGEEGVVTSVNDRYVFVRFGSQQTSQGCFAANLTAVTA